MASGMGTTTKETSLPFRPTARILQLLGDELIASARLAVFELVKNSYDADATRVTVRLDVRSRQAPTITITDDGTGMTLQILESVWLVPGNDHRQQQKKTLLRTPRHNRLPIGEKGLGRFAAHKLGNQITLVTRAKGNDECVVEIDWNELIAHQYLEDALVTITTREPELFTGEATGTRIQISDLRIEWTRGEIRRLHNQITSICSPFEESDDFQAVLEVPGNENMVAGLPDVPTILNRALWRFSFHLEDGILEWKYSCRRVPGLNNEAREKHIMNERLQLPSSNQEGKREKLFADESTTEGIGPVKGEFYAYDRDPNILKQLPDQQAITRYLDEAGGVRVYRDGIRVYNYGEQGDDWLGLDLRRVNVPSRRISRNIILGAVHLSLEHSPALVEKTNREGFVDTDASSRLRSIVLGSLGILENERFTDKVKIVRAPNSLKTGQTPTRPTSIEGLLDAIRREFERVGVRNQTVNSCLERIRRYHHEMQETLLPAGMSGMNLAVVFHEVERGVRTLHQALLGGADMDNLTRQAGDLAETLDGFSLLLRRNSQERHAAKELIETALRINTLRLDYHRINVDCPSLDGDDAGFHSRFAFNLVLGAVNNLIDNALHWLRSRWPDRPATREVSERKLYIGVSRDFAGGPAIVVADNGSGFQDDDPELLTRPFFTRKTEGMGLGLYYTSLAMELQGGQLAFPSPGEVELPEGFDGAVVALIFKEDK